MCIRDSNTVTQTGDILGVAGGPHSEFVFRHNVAKHNQYGMIGDGTNNPVTTLKQYFPGAVVRSNLFLGGTPNAYPEGNSFRKEERESADTDSAPGADEERLNAALDAGGRHPAP